MACLVRMPMNTYMCMVCPEQYLLLNWGLILEYFSQRLLQIKDKVRNINYEKRL
jgi:hypothetical protein